LARPLLRPAAAVDVDELECRVSVEQRALVGRAAVALAGGVEPALDLAHPLELFAYLGELAARDSADVEVV
jgi:hypothetical protein